MLEVDPPITVPSAPTPSPTSTPTITLALGWEYLTSSVAASDPSDRERSEWPPHPARVFMALAAAWFETGEDPAEGEALRWLETLAGQRPPIILGPASGGECERSIVTFFVPVNDKVGPSLAPVQSAPGITRDRRARTFPRRWVGEGACHLLWPDVARSEHLHALASLCAKVTRIGHSTSVVRMWMAGRTNWAEEAAPTPTMRWVPDESAAELHLRGIGPGLLDHLVRRFNREPRERHAQLMQEVGELDVQRRSLKGKGAREARAAIDLRIDALRAEAETLDSSPPLRPSVGLWHGYRVDRDDLSAPAMHTHFDSDMLVLACIEGSALSIASTLQVTRALRGAVMAHWPQQPAPAWISGHDADGGPARDQEGHLALVPLPFVGRTHADGHLLGVALVFPRSVDRTQRARLLGGLLLGPAASIPGRIELRLGALGTWTLARSAWDEQRRTLDPSTWTAEPAGAHVWLSATPVVLDRFPKADAGTHRAAWQAEVAEIVRLACQRIGLPEPVAVEVGTTPWLEGSARAVAKRRPLRGSRRDGAGGGARATPPQPATAALGDGFPPLPARNTNAPRPQVHVRLEFDRPVVGPVLIGAGRFLGYGLLKPVQQRGREHRP